MGTRQGIIKKTELSAFANPRAGGIIAMGVDEGDAVIAVQISDGASQVFIGTRDGMAIRFPEDDVRPMGRTAYGVRGISLREGDEVVAHGGGQARRHAADGDRARLRQAHPARRVPGQSRGGLGLKNVEITEKNGKVIEIAQVRRGAGVAAHHRTGQDPAHADRATSAPSAGRPRACVMDLEDGDRLVSVALVDKDEDAPGVPGMPETPPETPSEG